MVMQLRSAGSFSMIIREQFPSPKVFVACAHESEHPSRH